MIYAPTSCFSSSNFQPFIGTKGDCNYDQLLRLELEHELDADTQKIESRYPGGLAFEKTIDLSGLGLKHLPLKILNQCLNIERLNISGNDIHWLPSELKNLENLVELNISGNVLLQPSLSAFSWLLEMPNLVLVADDMGFNFTPRGWEGRFKSNQIPTDDEWMACLTQDPW